MDLICTNCGEPWEIDLVLHDEPEHFSRQGSLIEKCPCCSSNIKRQENRLSESQKVHLKERLSMVKEVCVMLGDDIDGAASLLEDFGLN